MRIAFFTDTYLPNVDGVVSSIIKLKEALEKRGHEVFVFAPSPDGRDRKEGDVHYLRSRPFPPYPQYRLALVRSQTIRKEIEELGIDIIHNHGVALTAISAMKCNVPKISTFHTNIAESVHYIAKIRHLEGIAKETAWAHLRRLYSRCDLITAPSKKTVKLLAEKGIKAEFLPNGIDISSFSRERRPAGRPLLIHVGRVVKENNLEKAFEMVGYARKIYPELRFAVIGTGPAMDYYKKMAEETGISDIVEFTGYVDDGTLREYYRRGDAFVFTSLFDTQGIVVLEALASGMPVLALEGSSGEEIIENMGTVFSGKEDFAEALDRAMEIDDARKVVSLEKYDIGNVVAELEKYYRKLST